MTNAISFQQRLQKLRALEPYAYQVAHYLLQDDAAAAEASQTALLEISQQDSFQTETPEQLRSLMKKLVIRTSLAKSPRMAQI
ncbi:hypothetical protein PAEN110709_08560 [Paenibacillus endophyticus]